MSNAIKYVLIIVVCPLQVFCQAKESWIDKPVQEWPRIALINHVQYKNGDKYLDPSLQYAATGFLIDNGKDTYAATVKHILWMAKNKKTKYVQINDELRYWIMTPKGNESDSVVIDKLLNEDSTEVLEGSNSSILERDWIVFSVKKTSRNIYPLKTRYTPVKPGEKVYILSCAYRDSACTVNEGRVLRKQGFDIMIERDMATQLGGSSGSPVIDANGFLIGIFSSGSTDNKTGKGVSIAISTEYLKKVLRHEDKLNKPKEDYGPVILDAVLKQGTRQAIKKYESLAGKPENYYIYNLRSANRNGLLETGQKLIELDRIKDAIDILEFNARLNSSYFVNHNVLARAYLQSGNNVKAIDSYKRSTEKNNDPSSNEAFNQLEKLNGKN